NPKMIGTKAAAHYQISVGPNETKEIRLRLTDVSKRVQTSTDEIAVGDAFGSGFNQTFDERRREADEFYPASAPPKCGADAANVMRQALAGMLWSKQLYNLDANLWLDEHRANPLRPGSRNARNRDWVHMVNENIISMPDKWEYPWYAAWDLA